MLVALDGVAGAEGVVGVVTEPCLLDGFEPPPDSNLSVDKWLLVNSVT